MKKIEFKNKTFSKEVFVNLNDIESSLFDINDLSKSSIEKVVFIIHPFKLYNLNNNKFKNLRSSLLKKGFEIEILLSNISKTTGLIKKIDFLRLNGLKNCLSGLKIKSKIFYLKHDIYYLDDYLILFNFLNISDYQFFQEINFLEFLNLKESFHLELFIRKQIIDNKSRKKQFFYRKQLKDFKNKYSVKINPNSNLILIDELINKINLKSESFKIQWPIQYSITAERLTKKFFGYFKPKENIDNYDHSINLPIKRNPLEWNKVMITGWYGTETNGDKAIIGELVYFLKCCNPEMKFLITTIHSEITLQTNSEIFELNNSEFVKIDEADKEKVVDGCDAVIIGGGPLMESHYMLNILKIFKTANKLFKNRIIFGCGVGPIHSDYIKSLVTETLSLSTAGFLRDKESFQLMKKLTPSTRLSVACDPALAFVRRWAIKNQKTNKKHKKFSLLLRANTNEFLPDISLNKLENRNNNMAKEIANLVKKIIKKFHLEVDMLQMNAPYFGGDDRIFNRLIGYQFEDDIKINFHREYLTIEDLLKNFNQSSFTIAMRYHGHIFSLAFGVPFLSIDYTGNKGKVQSLIERVEYVDYSIKWDHIKTNKTEEIIYNLINNKKMISNKLIKKRDILLKQLTKTYEKEFNIKLDSIKYNQNISSK